MENKLIFIGVIHGDKRIKKALEKIRPEIITVEMSKKYWDYLLKNNLKNSYKEIELAIKYAKKTKTPLFFIDRPPSKQTIKNRHNKSKKEKEESKKEIEEIYSYFKKHYLHRSKETEEILIYENMEHMKRTAYMANKLKHLLKNNLGLKIVHIGGAGHFINSKKTKTLFSSMKIYNPKRYLLTDLI